MKRLTVNGSSSIKSKTKSPLSEPIINNNTQKHLLKAAAWAKFLAILGFLLLIYLIVIFTGGSFIFIRKLKIEPGSSDPFKIYTKNEVFIIIFFLSVTLFGIVVTTLLGLFLYRFANRAKKALKENRYYLLEESFAQLRNFFFTYGLAAPLLLILFILVSLVGLFWVLFITIKIPL
ncbi:MAG: hypothetical protein GXO27_02285 [Chlorobi bacterium]|nr:hypothetical protein [Chlorobiota bacterium]